MTYDDVQALCAEVSTCGIHLALYPRDTYRPVTHDPLPSQSWSGHRRFGEVE
jgi:hypothetical protein